MKSRSGGRAPLKLAAVASMLALMLVSCSAGTAEPSATPEPAVSSAEPSVTPSAAAADSELVDDNPTDEWTPLAEVTDEYGSYTRLTIDSESKLLELDPETVEQEMLDEFGFTPEQAEEAQRATVRYLIEGFLDGERLDNYSMTPEEWTQSDVAQIWTEPVLAQAASGELALGVGGYAITDYLPQPLNRTGGQRGSHQVSVLGIEAFRGKDTGTPLVNVGFAFDSYYDTTEEAAQAALASNTGQPAEDFRDAMPALFDGDGVAQLVASGIMWFAYDPVEKQLNGSAGNWLPIEPQSGMSYYTGELPPAE
jgi:hypothetical protein